MAPYWTTLDNSYVTKEAGKVRSLASRFQIWKLGEDFVAKLLMFIWTNFELSVSGPGWKTALNRRVSISNKMSQIWLNWNEFPHIYLGVWRSVGSEFLRWKVALQALTMTSATRWQLIANEINLDCNCTKIETIITRHRNRIHHYQSSGGHFGWAEEYYRGEQKTKTFEWSFCPAITALKMTCSGF